MIVWRAVGVGADQTGMMGFDACCSILFWFDRGGFSVCPGVLCWGSVCGVVAGWHVHMWRLCMWAAVSVASNNSTGCRPYELW